MVVLANLLDQSRDMIAKKEKYNTLANRKLKVQKKLSGKKS
jgi:hypothetical protein